MQLDENKKALFVIGMDQDLQPLLQQVIKIKPENMLTLQTYGPEIYQPYGDLMRDIVLAVHRENIEDIFVVGTQGEQRNAVDTRELLNKICEQEGIQEKLKTITFLFENCMPEFQGTTLSEWLAGSDTVVEGIQKSVKFLRDHPLMPSNLRVYGLVIDKERAELSEIRVS